MPVAAMMALSVFAARAAGSVLFGLAPGDPAVLALACVLLLVCAGLATFVPARRAARLDPARAIRERG